MGGVPALPKDMPGQVREGKKTDPAKWLFLLPSTGRY